MLSVLDLFLAEADVARADRWAALLPDLQTRGAANKRRCGSCDPCCSRTHGAGELIAPDAAGVGQQARGQLDVNPICLPPTNLPPLAVQLIEVLG